jgi:PAS domain S-box-containing protein
MNPYALIPLLALFVNGYIWVYVYAQQRRDHVNGAFLLCAAAVGLWVGIEFVTWLELPPDWSAYLVQLSPAFWLPVSFLFLNFTYAVLARGRDRVFHVLLITTLVAVVLSQTTRLVVDGYEWHYWGADEQPGPLFVPFALLVMVVPLSYSLWLLFRASRQTSDPEKRSRYRLILRGGVLSILIGVATDVLPYVLGTSVIDLAATGTSVLMLHIYAAVVRHNLLSLRVETVAEDLFSYSREGVLAADPRGIVTLANDAARRLLAAEHKIEVGGPLPSSLQQTPSEDPLELTLGEGDGESILAASTAPLRRGDVDLGQIYVLRDVTERRRAEQALRCSEERFRIFSETTTEAVFLHRDGVILDANSRFASMVGYDLSEVIGSSVLRFVPPEEHEVVMARVRAESTERYQTFALRRDGTRFPIESQGGSLDYPGGPVRAVSVRDMSETRELETQIRQMQKMEAIGTLAGGIAHDFNNILTGVLGYAELLKLDSDPGDPVFRAADVIERAAARGAELTKQLLGFARVGKLQEAPVDVHELIRGVAALLGRTIDKQITVSQQLEAQHRYVLGDRAQLDQVLLNLGVNARDAMQEAGEILFATEDVELDEAFCRRRVDLRPGAYLKVTVEDDGYGIPQGIRHRIFEPFFTTKESLGGTGMGLAMVYGAVQNHKGAIEVDSTKGGGTRFVLYFKPTESAGPAEVQALESEPAAGRGRVLIVDDEEVVRLIASQMLGHLGYETLQAIDGADAISRFEKHKNEIDLVLLDLVMPRMGGPGCFRRLKAIDPSVKVVLSTGYAVDGSVQEIMDEGVAAYVQKPYRLGQLADAVARALEG